MNFIHLININVFIYFMKLQMSFNDNEILMFDTNKIGKHNNSHNSHNIIKKSKDI